MKKATTLLLVTAISLLSFQTYAQTFGIKGGLNLSNVLAKDDDDTYSDDFKMNPGFHIGPTVEFPLNEMVSFESGLLLSTKGFKSSEKETDMGDTWEYEVKLNAVYIDIPLTAKTTFDVGGAKIYGIFGPYVGIGLSGKEKEEYTQDGETETYEADIEWGNDEDEDHLKRLDYGLTAGAGIIVNNIQLGLSYDLGLANISAYTGDGTKIKNKVLRFSVGYMFGE
ncbi:porin family protein [Saccharicrinis sp. 156]|uniref:porin family protein n=1 Tax=Saccharicrinis sp. 156 TaxID=3417574 RepID=UPI003D34F4A7